MKADIIFVTKRSGILGVLAAAFSSISIFVPQHHYVASQISGLDIVHITGHIVWGLMAGATSLSLRYFLLAGSFAIAIDSDHLIQLAHVPLIERMAHSIPFGMMSVVVMMLLFGRKDLLLGAVTFSALLSHLSFDTFTGGGSFPLFVPFYDDWIKFHTADWVFFQIGAVILVGLAMLQQRKLLFVRSSQRT